MFIYKIKRMTNHMVLFHHEREENMIEKICNSITRKMREQIPDINDERAEVINYGLQLIIGEIPKLILLFALAAIFKIAPLVIFAYISMLPYKIVAGGFHLKTNIGCTIGTLLIYYGNVFISKNIVFQPEWLKLLSVGFIWVLSIIMIKKYAPADTMNLTILRKKDRRIKKNLSYLFATLTLIVGLIIKNNTLSNILIFNVLIETLCITQLAYKITKNEYGYRTYLKQELI